MPMKSKSDADESLPRSFDVETQKNQRDADAATRS